MKREKLHGQFQKDGRIKKKSQRLEREEKKIKKKTGRKIEERRRGIFGNLEKSKQGIEIGLGPNLFGHPKLKAQLLFTPSKPKYMPNPIWAPKNPKPN